MPFPKEGKDHEKRGIGILWCFSMKEITLFKGRLRFQVHWLPPNASWLDQIEIWFSLLQRKCLQPNHFVSAQALETALLEYIAFSNQTPKPINWTYTVEKLEQKLGKHL